MKAAVKPTGSAAEFRSIAAMSALRQHHDSNFESLPGVRVSVLLQAGHVFHRKSDDQYALSLGPATHAALMWRIEEFSGFFAVHSVVNLREPASEPSFWSPSSFEEESDISGVPTEICLTLTNKYLALVVTKKVQFPIKCV